MFGEYTPLFNTKLIAERLRKGTAVITELGLEKRCACCGEFWPQDTLFWSKNPTTADGLDYRCKACVNEGRSARRKIRKAKAA